MRRLIAILLALTALATGGAAAVAGENAHYEVRARLSPAGIILSDVAVTVPPAELDADHQISFLLGLITLGIATVYEGWDSGDMIIEEFGLAAPLVGLVAALVSAALAVRWLVTYLERRGLEIFGWYRIAIAVIGAGLMAAGAI